MKRFLARKELLVFSLTGVEKLPNPDDHTIPQVMYMFSSSHGKIIQKTSHILPNGYFHGESKIIDEKGTVFEIKKWNIGRLISKSEPSRKTYG
ncbi:hypothetical protein ISTM_368 [Insectomime virus]|uniref:Uncharacterized protein n=1 Tax=Tunisvirus fontaine2 TaxID=1421067 RepID=V9SEK0_9VIRU|nr:hypothetical protein D1R32_gp433 [Tunisvirus fontaine2]AHA46266.1 hypothetical protein ISTM_368 [Insectomime virus]AHC55150.1 hypothetical protein TNS_ORF432 [Tunisvirus fontaine2]